MTGHDDETRLAAELRAALEQRDRFVRAPRFDSLWAASRGTTRWTTRPMRPLAAIAVAAIVIATVMWTSNGQPDADRSGARTSLVFCRLLARADG